MDGIFYTLHDFMMHTKSITYIIIVLSLCSIGLFWRFLTDRNTEE